MAKPRQNTQNALLDKRLNADYKIITSIARGAMSEIYLARRNTDPQPLVIKMLDLHNPVGDASIERFVTEAELLASLNDRAVVKMFDYQVTDNCAFIVMEFLSRGNLTRRIGAETSVEVAVDYITQIIHGLDAIHRSGVVHRDIKPANIMFRTDESLTLIDFGIAQRLTNQTNGSDDPKTTEQVIGTAVYMSPEQGKGLKVDERADIYSAGIIFYELLTGERPFFSEDPLEVIDQHINDDIPPLPKHLDRFQSITNKMMAKDVADRYQSAAEILPTLGPSHH
jgi:serine/threonine-protein kinase PpkA